MVTARSRCHDDRMLAAGEPSWIRDLDHLDALSAAAIVTDPSGEVVYANRQAVRLHLAPGGDVPGVSVSEALLPQEDGPLLDEIIRQSLAGRPWTGRLAVRRADGAARPADVACTPVRHLGGIVALLFVVEHDPSGPDTHRSTVQLQDRLTRLARVTAELGTADDVVTVTEVVVSHAADAVGATVASLSLVVDDDTLALAGLRGGRDGAAQRWATYSRHDHTPAADVVRTGTQLVLTGRAAIERAYPGLEHAADGERSIVALPLKVVGRTIGVITLSFPGHRHLDSAELEFFGILADSCAQAVERVRSDEAARVQSARLRFLAEATQRLSQSLDYEQTLTEVARLAVPEFADWCAIDLVEDDRLHRLAVQHVDPDKVQLALDLERRYPSDRNASGGAWQVIRTGSSNLIPLITDEMLVASARDEEHLRLARELQLRSALTVPLLARGKVLGVLTWVAAESGRTYTTDDLAFAEDFAERCATAIDNSQLYSETLEAAARLQDAVLSDLTAGVPGWELAEFYSPAGRTDVGGDFFDAIRLPDGRLAMFVGDVMGRGVAAAAAMAQMRASVRAYIAVDPTPEVVLDKLDLLFTTYRMTQLVTLVYLVADPRRGELVYANAGHPPAVVLRADGTAEQLPWADDAPLGLGVAPRTSRTCAFHHGDTVLAFTDGLIERRDEDIDAGQRRLLEHARALGTGGLRETLPRIVESVRDHTREDDVAALAVRRVLTDA